MCRVQGLRPILPDRLHVRDHEPNENYEAGTSKRKKMVEDFKLDLSRCIVCGICVEVCNFDAIVMTQEHEIGQYGRRGLWADLDALHALGQDYEEKHGPAYPEAVPAGKIEEE